MAGGGGDDTYFIDNAGDVIIENANEGNDSVSSGINYTLEANVENLFLSGTASIDGTGNVSNNAIFGNAGNNVIDGGAGVDYLAGGAGSDTYVLARGYGADLVVEDDATAGNTDLARFLTGIANDQLWFRQLGNNLEVSIIGTSDSLMVQSWYLGNANHIEQFKTVDGNKTLLDTQVQNLVNAMAAFAPPSAGQTTLPSNYATALAPVIAANWQ